MFFEIIKTDPQSRARVGKIETPHGFVETPSYVPVATNASIRTLSPEDIPKTKTQIVISNTYHLWRSLGEEGLSSFPGIHEVMEWPGTVMTDSGGFQVFSFGAARSHGASKVLDSGDKDFRRGESLVRVTDAGVYFKDDGEEMYLDPELSMRIQEQLGSDIIFAFDEPSSPHHDLEYTKLAMQRTHEWAKRSLEAKESRQFIYGIVQGGAFKDLREESSKVIGSMPFDGFGIGGAFGSSFGSTSEETAKELEWSIPFLPESKPRHLLGIGRVKDVFDGVAAGVDTFDCVIPTREARHGSIWTKSGRVDLLRSRHATHESLDIDCGCSVCVDEGTTRMELHSMFKNKSFAAGRLATIHNLYFFNTLMEEIRASISDGSFSSLRTEYLGRLI